jgi:hypothetical protein
MSAFGTYATCGPGEIASAFKVKPDTGSLFGEAMGAPAAAGGVRGEAASGVSE